MSDEFSIDIISGVDKIDLLNAIEQVKEDLISTYKLNPASANIELNPDSTITITSTNKNDIKNICDTFNDKLGIDDDSVTINNIETVENSISGEVKHVFNLIKNMGKDIAQTIEDDIKDCTIETISKLKELGINVYMFTGDSKDKAISIASKVGIDNVNYEMLPEDKYNSLEHIIKNKRGVVAFVGDGINDAPVVKLADLGISMGLNGSDSAIEASDIVIMNDDISKILNAIKISKKTSRIIKENLIFAFGIKITVLILAILGLTSMFVAVFADVGVTILCILNTLRILKNN